MFDDRNPPSDSQIFKAAIKLPADARHAFLDRECGNNSRLRQEVESLLAAYDLTGDFLDVPAGGLTTPLKAMQCRPSIESPGTVIGNYKLLEQIGEGGFGVVFLAEQQEPVRRKVALKIIKPGMDTREVIARFEAERQALAMMDHPNIARVLDAGATDDGRPFFVMELVTGISVIEFCDSNQLHTRKRLELFTTICSALQHAHQKGVIHRDIKPSNVMVTLVDGRPVPKVIDFGIAKAISQRLTEKTLFTRYGQMVGTPQYMSPEQAEMTDVDIDTRSDIYSLGVLLYELLTGTTPLELERLRTAGFRELLRLIQEEEPPSPSQRVSTLGDRLATISKQRGSQGKSLRQHLRGDLDLIVMKALEKDRWQRYDTASGFAEDIQRYLAHEPIKARSKSTIYRLNRFASRNKLLVATSSIVLAVLVTGFLTTTLAWLEAINARQQEATQRKAVEKERDRANQNAAELKASLYSSLLARAEISLRDGKLNQARQLIDRSPEDLRGWEWKHLNLRAEERNLSGVMRGKEVPYFTPDGKHIIALGHEEEFGDGVVAMWDVVTCEFVRAVVKHDVRTMHGALSPDGKYFTLADYHNQLSLWETSSDNKPWRKLWTVPADRYTIRITRVAFSPDGRRIATSGWDDYIRVFSSIDGRLVARILTYGGMPSFSPDGRKITNGLGIWDVNSQRLLKTLHPIDWPKGFFRVGAFSSDGSLIASSTMNGQVDIYDPQTGTKLRSLKGHVSRVTCMDFSPDGTRIVTGSRDTTVRIWDPHTGQQLHTLGTHGTVVWGVEFSSDAKYVASCGENERILIWESADDGVMTLQAHDAPIHAPPVYTPDGRRIVTASLDGIVKVSNASSGKELRTFFLDESGVRSLAMHPNGDWFAVGSSKGRLQLRDVNTGTLVREFAGHRGVVYYVAFDDHGDVVVSAATGGRAIVWDVSSGTTRWEGLPCPRYDGSHTAFSPNGHWIATSKGRNVRNVELWDVKAKRKVRSLHHHTGVRSLAFGRSGGGADSNGLQLASSCSDGTIYLWNPEDGKLVHQVQGLTLVAKNLVFASNGDRLWTAGADGNIGVWNTRTGDNLLNFHAHDQRFAVAISPDGNTIASTSYDATVRFWEAIKSSDGELEVERRRVAAAGRLVDDRFRLHLFAEDVTDSLQSDVDLEVGIRETALEIVHARGDNAYALNRRALKLVADSNSELADCRRALRMSEIACRVAPDSSSCRMTLGMAQFRVGEYNKALQTLKHVESSFVDQPATDTDLLAGLNQRRSVAFIAMSLWRLGRTDEARREFERFSLQMREDRWSNFRGLSDLLEEAKQLFEDRGD